MAVRCAPLGGGMVTGRAADYGRSPPPGTWRLNRDHARHHDQELSALGGDRGVASTGGVDLVVVGRRTCRGRWASPDGPPPARETINRVAEVVKASGVTQLAAHEQAPFSRNAARVRARGRLRELRADPGRASERSRRGRTKRTSPGGQKCALLASVPGVRALM